MWQGFVCLRLGFGAEEQEAESRSWAGVWGLLGLLWGKELGSAQVFICLMRRGVVFATCNRKQWFPSSVWGFEGL